MSLNTVHMTYKGMSTVCSKYLSLFLLVVCCLSSVYCLLLVVPDDVVAVAIVVVGGGGGAVVVDEVHTQPEVRVSAVEGIGLSLLAASFRLSGFLHGDNSFAYTIYINLEQIQTSGAPYIASVSIFSLRLCFHQ